MSPHAVQNQWKIFKSIFTHCIKTNEKVHKIYRKFHFYIKDLGIKNL